LEKKNCSATKENSKMQQTNKKSVIDSMCAKLKVVSQEEKNCARSFSECSEILTVELPPVKEQSNPVETIQSNICIIGNSLVRLVHNINTKVIPIPGGKIDDIAAKLEENLPEKVIIHIGANDISNFENKSEEQIKKISVILHELKKRRKSVIISGIIPRPRMSNKWHNKALSLDLRVQLLCKELGFVFIDNWSQFYGIKGYHISDGIHLNREGTHKLEDNFAFALRQLN
jgi:hypothetical protein